MISEKRKFQNRMAQRTFRHGNWRQTYVDCGGLCLICFTTDNLEFHEPFGEDKNGWGILQARILLCNLCHDKEHYGVRERRYVFASQLQVDVNIEVLLEGGYDNWIKNHGLMDRFGFLLAK